MANTKLTKTLEQGVSSDFDGGSLPPDGGASASKGATGRLRDKAKGVPCRVCAMPLSMQAEKAIGVHIWCVANSRFNRIKIPRPAYGTRNK